MGEDYGTKGGTEKKKSNKILACIGTAVFLATVLLVAFFAPGKQKAGVADAEAPLRSQAPAPLVSPAGAATPNPADETDGGPAYAPFIYEKDADIFMASGANTLKLGSRKSLYGCYKEINCVLSYDKRYLYYIEDTDMHTGAGTLKKVSTDAASYPVTIERGVGTAEAAPGSGVIYIKNLRGVTGELYLYKDGRSYLIDKNVLPVFLRFSQGGSCISYIVQEGARVFALYVKKGDEEPRLVKRVTAEAVINDGVNLSRFIDAAPFDSGQVLYSVEENYNMPLYFYGIDGNTERICNDGYIIKTYDDGGFLYADIAKNNLWYKPPGAAAVKITENYSYSKFPEDTDRFLLMEHIGDGYANSSVMMYEVDENKGKTAISLGDDRIFEINAAFDCVVYKRGGKFYASRKTDTGWREVHLLEAPHDNAVAGPKSGIVARFDGAGANLYYFDEYECGPLYRYSLKDDKTEKLLDRVDRLFVFERTVYAHVASDKFYRIEGGETEMIAEGVRDVKETRGGTYLITAGSLEFIPEGSQSARALDGFTRAAAAAGSIEYRAPLEEDLAAALKVLTDEANYCLYKLGAYKGKAEEYMSAGDALALAQKLAGREDISGTERKILNYLAEGFKAYEGNGRKAAKASLQKAMDAYEKYLNSADGEEEG